MLKSPFTLRAEAKAEIYQLIDKHIRKLPKNEDGTINEFAPGFLDNDVDALRHAYVSGIFTLEYGEKAADMFGRLNELVPSANSSVNSAGGKNMDLWNNEVGRKYGKKNKKQKSII